MKWNDEVVVITGANKSIGKGMAFHFASLGASVVLGYRSSIDEIEEIVREIQEETGNRNVSYEKMDVNDSGAIEEAISGIIKRYKKIDVLVNNAGVSYGGALIPSNPLDRWEEIIQTNIMGTINCIHAVSLHMLTAQKGSIINIASLAGLVGMERLSAYSASKAGVIGLTRSLAKEYARFQVRVNAVAPGYIENTGMVDRIPEDQMNAFHKKIAMGHLGEVSDIAEAVSFLASSKSKYITGQTLVVDGGLM